MSDNELTTNGLIPPRWWGGGVVGWCGGGVVGLVGWFGCFTKTEKTKRQSGQKRQPTKSTQQPQSTTQPNQPSKPTNHANHLTKPTQPNPPNHPNQPTQPTNQAIWDTNAKIRNWPHFFSKWSPEGPQMSPRGTQNGSQNREKCDLGPKMTPRNYKKVFLSMLLTPWGGFLGPQGTPKSIKNETLGEN